MKLIIAEKPSVGLEIAKALGLSTRKDGYFEGPGYVVTWAAGHLVSLFEPHEYRADWAWKGFSFDKLPMIPPKFELKVTKEGAKLFGTIKRLAARPDVLSLVNACDAGREGELIFDYIYRASGCTKPIERLWTSAALTREAILREFAQLKPGSAFDGLRMAARARAAADWMVGMNGTRAVTLRQRRGLFSVGRVQTPVLGFLVAREKEILGFVPEAFTTLSGDFRTDRKETFRARFEFVPAGSSSRTHQIKDPALAAEREVLFRKAEQCGTPFVVASLDEAKRVERPPFLYDLTTLQRDANRKYGFSADKTLKLAQTLYERHKALTYPRTDSRHLPQEMRAELPAALSALESFSSHPPFSEGALQTARSRLNEKRERVFDDAKVGDHHALLPTANALRGAGVDETRIYALVANRLLAVFQDDLVTAVTDVSLRLEGTSHLFYARGRVVLDAGWTRVDAPAEGAQGPKSDEVLPKLAKGEALRLVKLVSKQEATRPPKRYSESDLLGLMENAGNKLTAEGKEILKGRGIGTPATRASILSTLQRREYARAEGRTLAPTEKGMLLIDLLPSEALKSPEMTAQWELQLAGIELDKSKAGAFSRDLNAFIVELVRALGGGSRHV